MMSEIIRLNLSPYTILYAMEPICILYSTASVNMTYMYIWQRVLGLNINLESCEFDKNLSEEQKPFSNRWNSCCIVVVLIMSNDSHIWLVDRMNKKWFFCREHSVVCLDRYSECSSISWQISRLAWLIVGFNLLRLQI